MLCSTCAQIPVCLQPNASVRLSCGMQPATDIIDTTCGMCCQACHAVCDFQSNGRTPWLLHQKLPEVQPGTPRCLMDSEKHNQRHKQQHQEQHQGCQKQSPATWHATHHRAYPPRTGTEAPYRTHGIVAHTCIWMASHGIVDVIISSKLSSYDDIDRHVLGTSRGVCLPGPAAYVSNGTAEHQACVQGLLDIFWHVELLGLLVGRVLQL